jgi:hypothetical protein
MSWFSGTLPIPSHVHFQVEFDSPMELLQKTDGKLKSLVDESNDKEVLYAMAGAY